MNSAITFRDITPDDFTVLLNHMADFYAIDGYPFDAELTRKNLQKFISNNSSGFIRFIHENGELAGYFIVCFGFSFEFGGRDAFLDELYLLPRFRGRGIGTKAVEYCIEEAGSFGVKALHLEVEMKNEPAFSLYKRMGFKEHPRRLMTKYITEPLPNNAD